MAIGDKVEVWAHKPQQKRNTSKPPDVRYGAVVYVSRFGWATVMLESGYPEAFDLDKLVAIGE